VLVGHQTADPQKFFSDFKQVISYRVASSLVFVALSQDADSQDEGPQLLFSYPCI